MRVVHGLRPSEVTSHERHVVLDHRQLVYFINSLPRTATKTQKLRISDSVWGGIQRWIPLTKGRQRGQHFIVMASQCNNIRRPSSK